MKPIRYILLILLNVLLVQSIHSQRIVEINKDGNHKISFQNSIESSGEGFGAKYLCENGDWVKIGQRVVKASKPLALSVALRRSIKRTKLDDNLSNAYLNERSRAISKSFRTGQAISEGTYVQGAGNWISVIEYTGYSGDLTMVQGKTITVLGRLMENGDPNLPLGTNYFRFQPNFRTGRNPGGGNVLDITDWSWAKNNAWIRASIDNNDIIQMISEPSAENIFINPLNFSEGLTITGMELGILRTMGLAPDPISGIIKKIEDIQNPPDFWNEIDNLMLQKPFDNPLAINIIEDIDMPTYYLFKNSSIETAKIPKQGQSNFFGGTANSN